MKQYLIMTIISLILISSIIFLGIIITTMLNGFKTSLILLLIWGILIFYSTLKNFIEQCILMKRIEYLKKAKKI